MKKTFSILHISDLHKEKSADYKFLLSSLEADSGKWAKEGIPAPDFISGKWRFGSGSQAIYLLEG